MGDVEREQKDDQDSTVAPTATVEFLGQKFELKDGGPSGYKLARFASAVRRADEGNLLDIIAAPLEFVESCLAKHELGRFRALADEKDADLDDLQDVIAQMWGVQTDRPTERPSDSTGGPTTTEPSSESSAAVKVSGRFDGRPDLRRHLRMAYEYEQASKAG